MSTIRASKMTLVVNEQILGDYFLETVEPILPSDFREGFHAILRGIEHSTTVQLFGYIEKERAQELWDFFYPPSRWKRLKRWVMEVIKWSIRINCSVVKD